MTFAQGWLKGTVLIEIEYRVAPARLAEFAPVLRWLRSVRQRDGAIRWDVWENAQRVPCRQPPRPTCGIC